MLKPPLIAVALPAALLLGAGGGFLAKTRLAVKPEASKTADSADATAPDERAKPDQKSRDSAARRVKASPPVYLKFSRQFVAPLSAARNSLMILEIQIELDPVAGDAAYLLEPRLRDAFLQVLLEAASRDALAGVVEDPAALLALRAALLSRARAELGEAALSVLILDVSVQHR